LTLKYFGNNIIFTASGKLKRHDNPKYKSLNLEN